MPTRLCMTSQDLQTEPIKDIIKELVDTAKKVEGVKIVGEIQELIDTTPEELTEDNAMELSASKPVPDDEEEEVEEAVPENKFTPDNLTEGF